MDKRLALLAIRLLVSVNLLMLDLSQVCRGGQVSVTLFTQMSQTVHGLVSSGISARVRSLRDGDCGFLLHDPEEPDLERD